MRPMIRHDALIACLTLFVNFYLKCCIDWHDLKMTITEKSLSKKGMRITQGQSIDLH